MVAEAGSNRISNCGSTAPSGRHQRAPPGSDCLSIHHDCRTPDTLAEALEAAMAERVVADAAPNPLQVNCKPAEHVAAGSFCEEVRTRMRKLQQEMQAREKTIASLNVQIQSLQHAHRHAFLGI